MRLRLKFRYRINALLLLAAAALIVVTLVTLVQGRRNERELSGIETRYVPLIELDRDLKRTVAQLTKKLEDAAGGADEARLQDAERSSAEILRLIANGATTIRGNGGDPPALEAAFRTYDGAARAVSTVLATGTPAARLADEIEAMRRTQQRFTSQLDLATSPDRTRLAAAFAAAHASQAESLKIDVIVAAARSR